MTRLKSAAVLLMILLNFSVVSHAQFLPEISFDAWTEILKAADKTPHAELSLVHLQTKVSPLQDQRPAAEIFSELKTELTTRSMTSAQDYQSLAIDLLNLRDDYRHSRQKPLDNRETLFMLQLLAEDTLYVGRKKFPTTFPNVVRLQDSRGEALAPRVAEVEGLKIQTGDVILSKAVGSGSSDFIAFLSQVPQIFSHSTPVYIEPKTNEALSPEALINDGVKLRRLNPEYASKARIYVYRASAGFGVASDDLVIQTSAQTATDAFVQSMYHKVSDPKTQGAYLYDMSFGGDHTGQKFVCSAVSQYIYSTIAGANQFIVNPYAESNLSRFNSRSNKLLSALSIKLGAVPSPGDLELNRFYQRVGLVIKVDKLEQERVEAAIVDFTLNYLGDQRAHQIIEFLDHLKNIKSEDIAKLEQLKIISQDKMVQLKEALQQVPPGVGLNQIAFFYFMDNVWTPMVRAEVLKQVGGANQIVGLDATYDIVAKTVKAIWKDKYQTLQQYMSLQEQAHTAQSVDASRIAAVTTANSADPSCIVELDPTKKP